MKLAVTLLIGLISANAWAGKFEVIGEGAATVPADFIKIDIQTIAECHTSALSARKEADDLAEKAIAALKQFSANIPEQLQTAPGDNLRQVKSEYKNGETIVICDDAHDWTASTNIQFRLNDLKQLAALQDTLLVLNPPGVPSGTKNVARLSLSLSKPEAGVLADTWDKMSDLALQRSMENALRQVKVLTAGSTQPVELIKVQGATTGSSGQNTYDRVDSEGDTAGIGLGKVSLKIARLFTYKVGP